MPFDHIGNGRHILVECGHISPHGVLEGRYVTGTAGTLWKQLEHVYTGIEVSYQQLLGECELL